MTSPWEPDPNRPKQPPAFADWVRFFRELSLPGKILFTITIMAGITGVMMAVAVNL